MSCFCRRPVGRPGKPPFVGGWHLRSKCQGIFFQLGKTLSQPQADSSLWEGSRWGGICRANAGGIFCGRGENPQSALRLTAPFAKGAAGVAFAEQMPGDFLRSGGKPSVSLTADSSLWEGSRWGGTCRANAGGFSSSWGKPSVSLTADSSLCEGSQGGCLKTAPGSAHHSQRSGAGLRS